MILLVRAHVDLLVPHVHQNSFLKFDRMHETARRKKDATLGQGRFSGDTLSSSFVRGIRARADKRNPIFTTK